MTHLRPSCWAPEDLDSLQKGLAQAFPELRPALRNAVVLLSMDEVRPREGLDALRERAVCFASFCIPDADLEHMLAS